jgi:hypothetical protein
VKLPYLARGLTRGEREDLLDEEAAVLGFVFAKSSSPTRSMTTPWGTIYMARPGALHVKAHELQHARDMGLFPWAWSLWYLAWPWHRRAAEVRAEAVEAAFYVRWVGVGDDMVENYLHATNLGGWRNPYWMGGNPAVLRGEALRLAREILAEND